MAFGRVDVIDWIEPPPTKGARPRFEAAVQQHVMAARIRAKALRENMSLKQIDFDMPMDDQRLGRVLRGELAIRFAELLSWQRYLDPDASLIADDVVRANLGRAHPWGTRREQVLPQPPTEATPD